MSSYVVGVETLQGMVDLTSRLFLTDKYANYKIGMHYDTPSTLVYDKITEEIYNVFKVNVASVNLQYSDNTEVLPTWKQVKDFNINQSFIHKLDMEELLKLNGYIKGIKYQIEVQYDWSFWDKVQLIILDKLSEMCANGELYWC